MTTIEVIAAACHEQNRAWCIAHGDESQVPWAEAPEWQRTSAINGVACALEGKTPRQQHEAWMEEKRADGWTYGPVKDANAKLHPCMVPYHELPPHEKMKDTLFLQMVKTLQAILGER